MRGDHQLLSDKRSYIHCMLSSYQRTSGYTVRQIEFPESMEGTITVKELGVGNVKLKRVYEKQGGELKAWLVKCHHDQE